MKLKRIHHIDFLVRDLDRAVAKYEQLFGVRFEPREILESRGAAVARFRLGDTWIALVQSTRPDGPIGMLIEKRGEGFYHIAYEVEDLPGMVSKLTSEGVGLTNKVPRLGIDGWKLVDLELDETFGLMTQLVDPK